jgi:hypothetical protein
MWEEGSERSSPTEFILCWILKSHHDIIWQRIEGKASTLMNQPKQSSGGVSVHGLVQFRRISRPGIL